MALAMRRVQIDHFEVIVQCFEHRLARDARGQGRYGGENCSSVHFCDGDVRWDALGVVGYLGVCSCRI